VALSVAAIVEAGVDVAQRSARGRDITNKLDLIDISVRIFARVAVVGRIIFVVAFAFSFEKSIRLTPLK
jgi:hypothetical protein